MRSSNVADLVKYQPFRFENPNSVPLLPYHYIQETSTWSSCYPTFFSLAYQHVHPFASDTRMPDAASFFAWTTSNGVVVICCAWDRFIINRSIYRLRPRFFSNLNDPLCTFRNCPIYYLFQSVCCGEYSTAVRYFQLFCIVRQPFCLCNMRLYPSYCTW